MTNQIKFEKCADLFNYLTSQLNFQSYLLEEGFEEFENKILASHGSSSSDEISWENFEWRDENGNDITVEIAFICNVIDEASDKFEDYYLVYSGK